jgi:hypothetical protein
MTDEIIKLAVKNNGYALKFIRLSEDKMTR